MKMHKLPLGALPTCSVAATFRARYRDNRVSAMPSPAPSDSRRESFAIDGRLHHQEGKTFKTNLENDRNDRKPA